MKVFITGVTGFVGRNLAEACARAGRTVYPYLRGEHPSVPGDTDIIYHCAAEIYDEDKMFDSNVLLTHLLLEDAERLRKPPRFVYVGSTSEYGPVNQKAAEWMRADPTNKYEATKVAGTMLTLGSRLDAVVARPFSVYGRYEKAHRLIPALVRAGLTHTPCKLSTGIHDFVYIDDFVDGLMMLGIAPIAHNIVNFCNGIEYTNHEVLALVEKELGTTIEYQPIACKPHDAGACREHWYGNNGVATVIYGWKPKYDIQAGIHAYASEEIARALLP